MVRQDGTPVPVPPGKQQALLAALLLRAGRPAGLDELAGVLWGETLPPSARVSLQNYVKRLRRTLGSDGGTRIVTGPDGYLIRVSPAELDVTRFETAVATGRAAARSGAWTEAAQALAGGLALWRGEPLAGIYSEVLAREVPRLAEMRLQALEARIEADLHLGRHAEVIAELRALTAAEPLRERLHGLLMTALHADGQQAAALAAYQAAREVLLDELGAEPGPELQRLQARVLTGEPGQPAAGEAARAGPASASPGLTGPVLTGPVLTGPVLTGPVLVGAAPVSPGAPRPVLAGPVPPARPDPPVIRYSLPPDTAAFTGRGGELERITAAVTDAGDSGGVVAIRAVNGMPGIGKTALAVHAGHLLQAGFPDRQLFVDLRGHTPGQEPVAPQDALAGLLAAVGVEPLALPADLTGRSGLWRDKMAGQKALLILDNAASSAQVTPLLPGAEGCLVLVTSRRHLADLPGAVRPVLLEVLPPDQARRMFTRLAPRAADAPTAAVAELTDLAGHLPLAISLLARLFNRHPAWTLADLAAETRARLLTLAAENDSVAAAFAVSYDHLDSGRRAFFRRLGLNPGTTVDAFAAAAVAGTGVAEAARLLDALHGEGLLTETGYRRYGMHDLIRRYAADQAAADPAADRDQALGRLLDYYEHTAARAEALLARQAHPMAAREMAAPPAAGPALPDAAAALAWVRAERASLLACADHAAATGDQARLVALAAATAALLRQDGPWAEAAARHAAAAAAAERLGDRVSQADALNSLGVVQRLVGDHAAATGTLDAALSIARATGDRLGQANILHNIGDLQRLNGNYPLSTAALTQALGIYRDLGSRRGQAGTLLYLGDAERLTASYPAAVRLLDEALELYTALGDLPGQATTRKNLAHVRLATGDGEAAAALLREALDGYRRTGDRLGQGNALSSLGSACWQTGDYAAAARYLEEGLAIFRDLGAHLGVANSLNYLADVRLAVGDYAGADAVLAESLAVCDAHGLTLAEVNALSKLGAVRRALADYPAAAKALALALARYADLGDRLGEAEVLNETGLLHQVQDQPGPARACFSQALDLALEISNPREEARALAGLARCDLAAGDSAAAAAGLARSAGIFRRIGAAEAAGVAAELARLIGA